MIQRLGELWQAAPPAFWLVLAACAYFAVMAVRLTVIDVRHHLLPNRIVFPSYAVAGVLLLGAVASLVLSVPGSGGPEGGGAPEAAAQLFGVPALRILAGGAVLWLFYFVLRLVYPPGMGFGDVKLAGVLGMYLGYLGGPTFSPEPSRRSCSAACGASPCWRRAGERSSQPSRSGPSCSPVPRPPWAAWCQPEQIRPQPSANGHLSPHPPAAPLNAAAARLHREGGRPPSYLREAVGIYALCGGRVMDMTSRAVSSCSSVSSPRSRKPMATTVSRMVRPSATAFLAILAAFS